MKKILYALTLSLALAATPSRAQEVQVTEMTKMMNYLLLAEQAGLDVPLYLMELSDQLAMASLSNYMSRDILEQGAAAAELYAHPLVCMNYAACQMKLHHYGTALHYLAIAWHQDKKNEMLATNIARCHLELGDEKLANAFVDRALELNPTYGLALQLKATLLLLKGDNESQQEAVEYVLRSALDVWNGISVKQFNSLIAIMEKLYDKYRQADIPDNLKSMPTPLDGYDHYFCNIARAGRVKAKEPQQENFPYPIPVRTLENDDAFTASVMQAALFGVQKDIYDLALGNDYMQQAMKVKIPTVASDFPTEYTALVGGNTWQPDSRAFTVTLLAWYYHRIKLLEANIKARQKEERLVAPVRKRTQTIIEAEQERMSVDPNILYPANLKSHGDVIYGATKEYIHACILARVQVWEEFIQPALQFYQLDIMTGLAYISDDTCFKYIQTRYDKDITEICERDEFYFFGNLQNDLDWGHYFTTEAEAMQSYISQQEQRYREELARTRESRFKDWQTNEKLKAAGMARLNRQQEPVPSVGIKIGGVSYQIGVDGAGRIHTRIDSPTETNIKVYNPETGASSTTVLTAVQAGSTLRGGLAHGRDPYQNLPKGYKEQLDLKEQVIASTGFFARESGTREGTQIVTDGRGNIIESSYVRESAVTVSVGSGFGDSVTGNLRMGHGWRTLMGGGASFTTRNTSKSRYGSSVISYSSRSTASFSTGFALGGFNLLSVSAGVGAGGL